jgi:hypothetical protein
MHITIRRYKTDSPKEITRIVNEGFFPLISKVAGFVAYYGIETDDGGWASVSVFETPSGAEESNRVAAEFIKSNENLTRLVKSPPEVVAGSVVACKAK